MAYDLGGHSSAALADLNTCVQIIFKDNSYLSPDPSGIGSAAIGFVESEHSSSYRELMAQCQLHSHAGMISYDFRIRECS